MPIHERAPIGRQVDLSRTTMRRIQTEVIPKTEWCIDRSTKSLDKCLSLQLESTHRLLDEND